VIEPGGIPQYTGDFAELSKAASDLRTHATGIRNGGQDVHARFQATAAYYKAPEAEQLFSSTRPVMDTADEFAADIESLAAALDTFVTEAKPHADRLGQLKSDAIDFVDSVDGDDDWTEDQDKVDRNQALLDGVSAAVVAFQEAERNAANTIGAISPAVCRPLWVADDGSHGLGMYGVDAEALQDVEDLPWGSPEDRTYERWSLGWWGHGTKSWVWDGIVKDSVWGGIDGLGTLIGYHGAEARTQAWDGLRRTLVGAYAYGMDWAGQDEHVSDWQHESEAYAKEFGKQFIAYDTWEEDPARAHAVVFFNLITLGAGPAAGVARFGKGGSLARAAGTMAKIGDALDPISGSLKAVKAVSALPRVSDTLANVSAHLHLPKTRFPDGALDLSDRYRIDKDGNLIALDPDGTPNTNPVRHEPGAAERVGEGMPGDREAVGVGGRAGEATAQVGGHLPTHGEHGGAGAGGNTADPPHGGHGDADHGGSHDRPHDGASGGTEAEHSFGGSGDEPGVQSPAGPETSSPGSAGHPLARGGEEEAAIRAAVKEIPGRQRPKPDVLERVLNRLASEPDGKRIADIITSGHFNQSDEYGQVVSAMGAKKEHMFQPAADQLIFADELVRSGVPAHTIDFEQKYPVGADMDIRVKDESGEVYAYQMKHLNNPQNAVSEITRGKYLLQLASSEADHTVMLVDGARGTVADWMSNGSYDELMAINSGARGRKGMGITFVVRLEDGNLVIPPGSKTDPKDML
jgi:hypothetical protein